MENELCHIFSFTDILGITRLYYGSEQNIFSNKRHGENATEHIQFR